MVLSRFDGNFLVGWSIWGNSCRSHSFTYSELDSPASKTLDFVITHFVVAFCPAAVVYRCFVVFVYPFLTR